MASVDGFDECGGLAGTWRSVHHHDILGAEYFIDSMLLCGIEPGEAHGAEVETLGRHMTVEEIAQIGEASALGTHHTVEGVEHRTITGLVERELHAHGCLTALHVECMTFRDGHHHAVAVDIRHCAREAEELGLHLGGSLGLVVAVAFLHAEEDHGLAVFEVVLYALVGSAVDLQRELVERVVIAFSYTYGIPGIATFDACMDDGCDIVLQR